MLSPLRPQTPAHGSSNRTPEAKCSRVLGSQRRSSQFLVFLSTCFLLRGLPRGSEGGEGRAPSWGNPRPRRARVVGLLVAHMCPTSQCSFLPRKFDSFGTSKNFEWRAFENRLLYLTCKPSSPCLLCISAGTPDHGRPRKR